MSLKKKRKSSCPFASANQADVLVTIVIKNKIDGRTIPFVLAGRKMKAKAMTNLTNPPEPDPQESWQSWPINQLLPAIACKNIS